MNIRDEILNAVEKEIVGPSSDSNYLDESTKEEILLTKVHGHPKARYGAGMLYPQQSVNREIDDSEAENEGSSEVNPNISEQRPIAQENATNSYSSEEGIDEEPVGLANQYLPSAMGFTVRFYSDSQDGLVSLEVKSAYYEKGAGQKLRIKRNKEGEIEAGDSANQYDNSDYWIRRPFQIEPVSIDLYSLLEDSKKSTHQVLTTFQDGSEWLSLRVYNRTSEIDKKEGFATFTFVIINSQEATTDNSENSRRILYQNKLTLATANDKLIAPYKERHSNADTDEEQELKLLYRKKRIYSIGHGTSVSWDTHYQDKSETVKKIETTVIPSYDLPQVAPTVFVTLSMLDLSDLGNWEKAKSSLEELITKYSKWIEDIDSDARTSPELEDYREAALSNVEKCKTSLERIRKGVELLQQADEDSEIVKCFRWMNRAMIWQQQRSKTRLRKWTRINTSKSFGEKLRLETIDGKQDHYKFPSLQEFHDASPYNGRWRPFQLAFILMNIESIVNPTSSERKIVDLIWFPTGGGKTEAYLGLSAFNIFYRRIKGKKNEDSDFFGGTAILMRYTLRLLTTQQYERAASLICACDLVRRENKEENENNFEEGELGDEPISIGLFVGRTSSPNENKDAISKLKALNEKIDAEYNFVVMKCPCCGAQIGKVENSRNKDTDKVKGIKKSDGKNGEVRFQCENEFCEYSQIPLPLQVIDELIYRNPPTLLLGTVDKFAMVPWKKEAGSIFGFREDERNGSWSRICPPELIIQDELHLIAGPLGTMVGLYETMIQTLCNNYNRTIPPFIDDDISKLIPPKIIASSATISRSYEQVKSLYGIESRDQLNIFPAQGLTFGDTWFSEEKSLDKFENGLQAFPGRKYVGILASGYPSAQTAIVRSYASVLQKVKELSCSEQVEAIDFYWTLLGYFNSIRELGGASSLVYGDIRERLGQIQNRDLAHYDQRRYINRIEELTSRISSSEIPSTLKKLETKFDKNKNIALDICLATNMVATGVDISRLGLMFIHGQPKTTAEYIQASSRVGRKLPSGPGIIFTLYSPSKPRDKSQYEQFQAYHSRIYSNVEPTSVTPFSINARERGMHAIQIGLVRHLSGGSLRNSPDSDSPEFRSLMEVISKIILNRCKIVDPDEEKNTKHLLKKNFDFWEERGFRSYGDAYNSQIRKGQDSFPLMYSTSTEFREDVKIENRSLPTPTSMRGVDTESVLSIYSNSSKDGE